MQKNAVDNGRTQDARCVPLFPPVSLLFAPLNPRFAPLPQGNQYPVEVQEQTTVAELAAKAATAVPGTSAEDRVIFVYHGRTLKPQQLVAEVIGQSESESSGNGSGVPAVLYTIITVLAFAPDDGGMTFFCSSLPVLGALLVC